MTNDIEGRQLAFGEAHIRAVEEDAEVAAIELDDVFVFDGETVDAIVVTDAEE